MKKFLLLSLGFFTVLTVNARDPSLNALRESSATKPLLEFEQSGIEKLNMSFIKGTRIEDYFNKASWKERKKKRNLPRTLTYAEYVYHYTFINEYYARPDNVRKKFEKKATK